MMTSAPAPQPVHLLSRPLPPTPHHTYPYLPALFYQLIYPLDRDSLPINTSSSINTITPVFYLIFSEEFLDYLCLVSIEHTHTRDHHHAAYAFE